MFGAVAAGGGNGIRGADGLWQVAGDGRGLRRDHQRAAAKDLVPAAGDRVLGGRGEGEKHVAGDGLAGDLFGPRDLEGGVAVVEEGDVGGAQGGGDRGKAFVARGADGVEALSCALHGAALAVERAAEAGGAVEGDGKRRGQGALRRAAGGQVAGGDAAQEVVVDDVAAVHQRAFRRAGRTDCKSCAPR